MGAVTAVHHLSLTVRDLPASIGWYTGLFGMQEVMTEDHQGGRAVVLMHPETGVFLGLHHHAANGGQAFSETVTGLDHISFAVPSRRDLVAWETRLRDRGITSSPIADRPWGSVLVFRDPDNIQLELCSPPAEQPGEEAP